MSWSLDGKVLSSVLVTRLRYLGDIVMSTVVARVLKDGDPDLDIGYLCEDGFAGVLDNHPDIGRVHRLRSGRRGADAKARTGSSVVGPGSQGTPGMVMELRRIGYDLAVDLFFNPRSAWLLKMAGIPQRIGGTRKWRGRLYTHRVLRSDLDASSFDLATVAPGGLGEHLCRLAPLVHVESGQPFISYLLSRYGPGDLVPGIGHRPLGRDVAALFEQMGVDPAQPFLLLAPNATWPSKEWPAAHWEKLVSDLLGETDFPVIVLGAPGGREDWTAVAGNIPAGRGGMLAPLPLVDAVAVVAAARLLVTVDGGIMHAAVGLGTPTLALFGPTDRDVWFPYEGGGPFRVLATAPECHPCDLHECPAFICLPELAPAQVVDATFHLLGATDIRSGGRP